ncbi:ABC transporter permease [Paracoccus aminovorans]|uniref:ABC transporter permease n=1 Tax=Paracoccus aminovorans TaxID=34004 RepID=UPI002B2596AC|nr:ABC transporter permease [Paracoccus aminovorans]
MTQAIGEADYLANGDTWDPNEAGLASRKESKPGWLSILMLSKTGLAGVIIVATVILVAIFAPAIAPHDPAAIDLASMFAPPMWLDGGSLSHPLGTDNLGRDVLSRILYGSRTSLIVGVCAVVVAGCIGTLLGLVAGFYGSWVGNAIMRVTDSLLALPAMLIMLVIVGVFGPSLVTLIFVMGCTKWVPFTRLVRGEVLSLKERDYVRAAYSIGTPNSTIILRHLLPNVLSTVIVVSTLSVGTAIISESSLSFLGLGIQPPDVSWGYMLSEGQTHLSTSWWIATFPGIALSLTVIGFIFLGDWLRDATDPRLQGRA